MITFGIVMVYMLVAVLVMRPVFGKLRARNIDHVTGTKIRSKVEIEAERASLQAEIDELERECEKWRRSQ